MNYKQHPLSAAFPAMVADDFQALCDDIEVHGQREPVIIFEGMVLDGWHRYQACLKAGFDVLKFPFNTEDDPVAFVKSQNLHRRHLTQSQRAAAEVACSSWHPAHREKKSVPGTDLSKTDAQMAKEAGVSISTIGQAKAAQKAGLIEAVRDGAMTAKEAAKVARGTVNQPAKPTAKPEVKLVPVEGAPDEAEFNSIDAAEKAEADAMRLLLASDAPLSDVTEKYKQALLQISMLEARIVGMQNQSAHQIKTIKGLQKKLERMEQPA